MENKKKLDKIKYKEAPNARHASPDKSVASSSRSWTKNYGTAHKTKFSEINNNSHWRNSQTIDTCSSEEDEPSSNPKAKRRVLKKYNQPQKALDHQEIVKRFSFKTFEQIKSVQKTRTTFERKDWFGLREGIFCGKQVRLKYLHLPEDLQKPIDLTVVHEEDKLYLPVEINENINEILTWIRSDFHKPSIFGKFYSDVEFVTTRLEISQILQMPYAHSRLFSYAPFYGIDISAVRMKGKIYLCAFFSQEEKMSRRLDYKLGRGMSSSTAGLIFQKSITSDSPHERPNINLPFDRKAVEFFLVDKMSIGGHTIIIQNKFKAVWQEDDLQDLQNFEYCEPKTSFKPYNLKSLFAKLTRCWAGNINKVIMGVKELDSSHTLDIEILNPEDIYQKCQTIFCEETGLKNKGVPLNAVTHPKKEVCDDFADRFLTFLKSVLVEETRPDTVYLFEFRPANDAGNICCKRLTGKASKPYSFIGKDFMKWLNKV